MKKIIAIVILVIVAVGFILHNVNSNRPVRTVDFNDEVKLEKEYDKNNNPKYWLTVKSETSGWTVEVTKDLYDNIKCRMNVRNNASIRIEQHGRKWAFKNIVKIDEVLTNKVEESNEEELQDFRAMR